MEGQEIKEQLLRQLLEKDEVPQPRLITFLFCPHCKSDLNRQPIEWINAKHCENCYCDLEEASRTEHEKRLDELEDFAKYVREN